MSNYAVELALPQLSFNACQPDLSYGQMKQVPQGLAYSHIILLNIYADW